MTSEGTAAGLPAVVEQLLIDVVADGFTLYTVRDFERVTTVPRVPTRGTVDIFAPDVVVWAYQGPPQQALRALLDLVTVYRWVQRFTPGPRTGRRPTRVCSMSCCPALATSWSSTPVTLSKPIMVGSRPGCGRCAV